MDFAGQLKHVDLLISDLEAEWCKAMEWCEANYSQFGEGKWQNWGAVDDTMYTTDELLKIYQNKEK